MSTPSPLRFAFVGVTHPHATAWADAVKGRDDCLIAAAFDPDPTAARLFGETYGCSVIPLGDLPAGGYDAVVVDGRNDQAPLFADAALDAGAPVFIEKTGAMCADHLRSVAEKARTNGKATQMGFFLRFSDGFEIARRALAQGTLGRLSLARFHCAIAKRAWTDSPDWFGDTTNVVGPFMEAGCHMVDIVRELLGEPVRVAAASTSWKLDPNPSEDAVCAALQYEDFVASIDFTAREANPWNSNWTVELYGEDGTLHVGLTPVWARLNTGGQRWTELSPRLPQSNDQLEAVARAEYSTLMARGMDHFVRTLKEGGEPAVDAASGAETLRLIESIYRSANS